jgi:hypothetical protein
MRDREFSKRKDSTVELAHVTLSKVKIKRDLGGGLDDISSDK